MARKGLVWDPESEARGRRYGYRSGLEVAVAAELDRLGVSYVYEPGRIRYMVPATERKYTPDFVLSNGVVVETKGRFTSDDRKKILLIKKQYPGLDLRVVFQRATTRLSKTSRTTYADWCEKHGIIFAEKKVPIEWLEEPPTEARIAALKQALGEDILCDLADVQT